MLMMTGPALSPENHYDCDGVCIHDKDGDAVCDPLEISGCTWLQSHNYDSSATEDDGSCNYIEQVAWTRTPAITM